ncbi:MAG: hypothetical protein OEV81_11590 [Betaproteobacteria bacterium]|nr:hypothetical protein [Betaproteobacteria bacterium]MDH5222801.1 hypothetical protein [Betaproteobacteria bacterium]MDH5350235.1 hypothetical protein [Betaproteobacteria bacterium]
MRGRTGVWLALLAAPVLAYAAFGHWLTTARGREALGALAPYLPWLYLLQHVAMFVALAAWFAASLRPGREAQVTRFARAVNGTLSPRALAYTRRVTLAWALFCAAMAALSVLLYVAAPLSAWSLFANVLTLPLVGAMFVAEYVVRLRACPEQARGGFASGVLRSMRAYWDSIARSPAGPR